VDRLIERTSQVRHIPADALKGYREMIIGDLVNGPSSQIAHHWAARQAYIALGGLLTSAALLGVDATPMEGFSPAEYDRLLGLAGSGYASVVCCALGYRAPQDKYATLPKVRFEAAELIEHR
jgi:nitroreductase